jgi:hypothetical protein
MLLRGKDAAGEIQMATFVAGKLDFDLTPQDFGRAAPFVTTETNTFPDTPPEDGLPDSFGVFVA